MLVLTIWLHAIVTKSAYYKNLHCNETEKAEGKWRKEEKHPHYEIWYESTFEFQDDSTHCHLYPLLISTFQWPRFIHCCYPRSILRARLVCLFVCCPEIHVSLCAYRKVYANMYVSALRAREWIKQPGFYFLRISIFGSSKQKMKQTILKEPRIIAKKLELFKIEVKKRTNQSNKYQATNLRFKTNSKNCSFRNVFKCHWNG